MKEIDIAGAKVVADHSGALWWPAQRLLAVADLHFEKGSAYAVRTAQMLPPYDTHETIRRVEGIVSRFDPLTLICLGDNFHDPEGPERLDAMARRSIQGLMRGRRFIWIEGNHDAAAALVLGGESAPEFALGPLVFRHEPEDLPARGEVCGHLHPVCTVETRARRLRRRCFASDGERCVLPAIGAYTGGLDVGDAAISGLFPRGFTAYLLGRDRIYPFAQDRAARRAVG